MHFAALAQSATIGLLLAAAGMCAGPAAPEPANRVAGGQWGGQHVGMQVADAGAELEFDCAHGRISEPVALDRSGAFDVAGSYVREQPGPTREDDEQQAQRVRYKGRVNGKRMTLTIAAAEGASEAATTFTLEQGAAPTIRKCL